MAFCKAIAVYQEPIYLQFAAGREGAAGGLEGAQDICVLPRDPWLVRRAREVTCPPAARCRCSARGVCVRGRGFAGLCGVVRAAAAVCQELPRCPALLVFAPCKAADGGHRPCLWRGAGTRLLVPPGPADGSGFARSPSPSLSAVLPPQDQKQSR